MTDSMLDNVSGFIAPMKHQLYPAANWKCSYMISKDGMIGGINGINVFVGDVITCVTVPSAAGTQEEVGDNWVIRRNCFAGNSDAS